MFTKPDPKDYPQVSHWTGCDVEQPYNLALEMWERDMEEAIYQQDAMEARGGPVFSPIYPDGEIPF